MRERSVEEPLTKEVLPVLDGVVDGLDADAREQLHAEGVPEDRIRATAKVLLKYDGTHLRRRRPRSSRRMVDEFERAYRRRFAFLMPDRRLVVEAVSVELVGASGGHRDVAVPMLGTGARARGADVRRRRLARRRPVPAPRPEAGPARRGAGPGRGRQQYDRRGGGMARGHGGRRPETGADPEAGRRPRRRP